MTPISDGEVKLATRAGLWSADQLCGDILNYLQGVRQNQIGSDRSFFAHSV